MDSIRPYSANMVEGFLHEPAEPIAALVLTHGAGLNCEAPLLLAMAQALCKEGMLVLRCNLRFRQKRISGPPFPAGAAEDRAGIREALAQLEGLCAKPLLVGGHSYGGRQSSLVMAEEDAPTVRAMLLLSYPFHPPRKPQELRTAHFPHLHTPAFFVHGERDSFGSPEEAATALTLLPSATARELMIVAKSGHELSSGKAPVAEDCAREFRRFVESLGMPPTKKC